MKNKNMNIFKEFNVLKIFRIMELKYFSLVSSFQFEICILIIEIYVV